VTSLLDILSLIPTYELLAISLTVTSLLFAVYSILTPHFAKINTVAKEKIAFQFLQKMVWRTDFLSQFVVLLNVACSTLCILTIVFEIAELKVMAFTIFACQMIPLFGMILYFFTVYYMVNHYIPYPIEHSV